MAESQRNRVVVWLAASSALLVLLASGVAVSRLGNRSHDSHVASAPETPPVTGADSGPASGPAGGPHHTDLTAEPSPAPVAAPPNVPPATVPHRATTRPGASAVSSTPASSTGTSGSAAAASGGAPSEAGQGRAAPSPPSGGGGAGGSGASPGGGQASPPAPSQQPPEETPLIGVAVSAGRGETGGVVGAGLDSGSPDADVTVGSKPVVGNHPPSKGTGVSFSSRLFHPPPSVPVLPG